MTAGAGFLLASVAIGEYDQAIRRPYANIDAKGETQLVAQALEPYGAAPWSPGGHPEGAEGSWYEGVLDDWAYHGGPASSILIWVGHGEDRTGAWLATPRSGRWEKRWAVTPEEVADRIVTEWETRAQTRDAWVVVVIEACGAERFVRSVVESFINAGKKAPARIALIGAGGRGEAFLGTFRKALVKVLDRYDINTHRISVADLVRDIEDQLGVNVGDEQAVVMVKLGLARPIERQAGGLGENSLTGAVDVLRELEPVYRQLQDVIAQQPQDQQLHFIPKAQGCEQGELAWYFEGRSAERREIRRWLDNNDTGLLVVTGSPGSGKSALLGNLVVHATRLLRDLLIEMGMLQPLPEDEDPGGDTYQDFILLTGASAGDLIKRLTDLMEGQDHVMYLTLEERIEHLLASAREAPMTVLVDALDEAQNPLRLAGILRRLAEIPGCRVILGTRASTEEGPDLPLPDKKNILDELNAEAPAEVVRLTEDPGAVERYAARRLSAAYRDAVPTVSASLIDQVAHDIGARNRAFLYARLAIHELIQAPDLLTDARRAGDLASLLASNHEQLFAQSVERLRRVNPAYELLLKALAFGKGRGLPRTGRIWRVVANALAGEDPPLLVTEDDIDAVLRDAAPYIMLDGEEGQSVYRLAHRTFQEFFLAPGTP